MLKATSQFIQALMFMLFCLCAACSRAEPLEPKKPQASQRSIGCGIAQTGTGSFVQMKMRVLDLDRSYQLRVPRSYDPNRQYPLIFRWHGAGGNSLSGGLGIESSAKDDAIIVSGEGLNNFWDVYTADSVDLRFFDAMLKTISSKYCIDRERVFSYGFSVGGTLSNSLACRRSDVLRASAAVASGLFINHCQGNVATWLLHDINDDVVAIAKGKAVRDRAIARNGCSTNTIDEGNGCVRFKGCDATPVVWCESKGFGHNIRGDFAPAQAWKFFQGFH